MGNGDSGLFSQSRLVVRSTEADVLEAQRAELQGFLIDLDAAESSERAALEARSRGRQQPLDGVSLSPEEPVPGDSLEASQVGHSEVIERSMSHAGQAAPYDGDLCLFVTSPETLARSTAPRRIDVSQPGFDDPLLLRAVKMLETPGLLHMMVIAERSQVVIDVDSYVVPEAALGLPLADAYVDQTFSLDALNALTDPERAGAFLAKVIRDEPDPEQK